MAVRQLMNTGNHTSLAGNLLFQMQNTYNPGYHVRVSLDSRALELPSCFSSSTFWSYKIYCKHMLHKYSVFREELLILYKKKKRNNPCLAVSGKNVDRLK